MKYFKTFFTVNCVDKWLWTVSEEMPDKAYIRKMVYRKYYLKSVAIKYTLEMEYKNLPLRIKFTEFLKKLK